MYQSIIIWKESGLKPFCPMMVTWAQGVGQQPWTAGQASDVEDRFHGVFFVVRIFTGFLKQRTLENAGIQQVFEVIDGFYKLGFKILSFKLR